MIQDTTKTQCNICLKFITIKSLSKHMSAFHKESLSTSENNNNVNNKSRTKKGSTEEKTNPCQYCKKSFVSPAKLRLHVAKCHAAERHKNESLQLLQQRQQEDAVFEQRSYFDEQMGIKQELLGIKQEQFGMKPEQQQRYSSPVDSMPCQQVPELDLPYINSSPEDLNDINGPKELSGGITFQIPTIHIPEFESKIESNEITTEALQALFFN